MRWDDLFADLEAQLDAAGQAGLVAEVADRTRREAADLALVDRLRASCGARVVIGVAGVGAVDGMLSEVGPSWLLVGEAAGREALVPLPAVLSVRGLGARTAPAGSGGRVFARLGLGAALRGIARDRAVVTILLRDGTAVPGRVDRVGADFVEVTVAGPEAAEPGARAGVWTVPMSALAVVRRTG